MARAGSTAMYNQNIAPGGSVVLRGPKFISRPGWPHFGLLNANKFAYGVANLGWQVIAEYLMNREINVHIAFADTPKGIGHFFIDTEVVGPVE